MLQQACLVQFQDKMAVVLATSHDLQVWDTNMRQQLFSWNLTTATAKGTPPTLFCRGIALVEVEDGTCLLCVGSSTGVIHTFSADSSNQLHHSHDLCHHNSPIVALASSSAPDSSSSASCNHLASCDDQGAITVFEAKSAGDIEVRHKWEGHGVPCVSVAITASTLLAAFYDGSVRLYSTVRHNLMMPSYNSHL